MSDEQDPFEYIANEQTYTSSKPCPKAGKTGCNKWFSGEGKTQAIADMLASRAANEHARDDH